MAKIRNTSTRQYDVRAMAKGTAPDGFVIPGELYVFPRAKMLEDGTWQHGIGEMDDADLKALLAGDAWAKGVFDSGDLVVDGSTVSSTPKAVDKKADAAAK